MIKSLRNAKAELQEYEFPNRLIKQLDEVIDILEDMQT